MILSKVFHFNDFVIWLLAFFKFFYESMRVVFNWIWCTNNLGMISIEWTTFPLQAEYIPVLHNFIIINLKPFKCTYFGKTYNAIKNCIILSKEKQRRRDKTAVQGFRYFKWMTAIWAFFVVFRRILYLNLFRR